MNVRLDEGIKAFCEKFAEPYINPDNVLRGNQRTAVLPKDDEFIVFRLLSQRRVSKTENRLVDGMDAERYREYVEADFQIDCYGKKSFDRARRLELLAETHKVDTFFQGFGFDALYTSNVQNITGVLDDKQLTERWMFTLTVGYCNDAEISEDYALALTPALIEINATFKDK